MAAEDSSFNSSGDTVVAFKTINTKGRPEFGVSVDADVCGVYGQGGTPPPHDPTASPVGTGVLGRGDFHGVYGVSARINDVDTPGFVPTPAGIGVVGVNNGDSPAILADNGILKSDRTVAIEDLTQQQMGVAAVTRSGPGVFGLSLSNDLSEDPHVHDTVLGNEFHDNTNVQDAGVAGLSLRGPGVRGVSWHDRGGVFESAQGGGAIVAQLRLFPTQPAIMVPGAPPQPDGDTGEAGDLLALNYIDANRRTRASLWFCVEGVSTFGTAVWVRLV
jgi:hypothetical protein